MRLSNGYRKASALKPGPVGLEQVVPTFFRARFRKVWHDLTPLIASDLLCKHLASWNKHPSDIARIKSFVPVKNHVEAISCEWEIRSQSMNNMNTHFRKALCGNADVGPPSLGSHSKPFIAFADGRESLAAACTDVEDGARCRGQFSGSRKIVPRRARPDRLTLDLVERPALHAPSPAYEHAQARQSFSPMCVHIRLRTPLAHNGASALYRPPVAVSVVNVVPFAIIIVSSVTLAVVADMLVGPRETVLRTFRWEVSI